ncbi:unnamed protein product [Aphanomyces euteiches]|nr:hypothetical protein AeRB84_019808 [Aphanomyces euteiches]
MAARTQEAQKFLRGSSQTFPNDMEATRRASEVSTVKSIEVLEEAQKPIRKTKSQCRVVIDLLLSSYLNLFLFFIPVAAWSYFGKWGDVPIFVLNFLAMMPLANLLGETTESLAEHCGDTIGGLINATFGNAVEVIIAVFALKKGEIALVQSSLLGSMLSNLLLVLGCCFIASHVGGASESSFSGRNAATNMSLLFVTSFAMLVPTYYQHADIEESARKQEVLTISRISAIFLILMYLQLLLFQLYTHRTPPTVEDATETEADVEDEDDEPPMSFWTSLAVLAVSTALVSVSSEFLVASVDGFTEKADINRSFVGIILLPIVGNAVEHVTAIKVALKNNMELALGVAVGSATQISLFVVPFCVIAGWIMGQPMTLAFPTFDAVTYVISIVIVYAIISNGTSNWLEGAMLLTLYCLIGVALLEMELGDGD